MRYALGLLASLLLCSTAHAAPVSFAIDLLFPPFTGVQATGRDVAVGPQLDAGRLSFEDVLGDAGTASFIPFENLLSFNVSAAVRVFNPGDPAAPTFFTFGTTEALFQPNSGGVCQEGLGQCGLLFVGRQFFGFQGSFFARPGVQFFGGNLLNLAGIADDFGTARAQLRELPSPVPEPSTWGILGLGGLAMGLAARKRKDRQVRE